jgi:hypothetical protein
MNCVRALPALALTIVLVSGCAPASAAQPDAASRDQPGEVKTPMPSREGDALDRFTAVAAVVSIVLVAVAGVYVYGRIRKGL